MKYTLEEWIKEGTKRFGTDKTKWKFVCPMCGHVQTQQDFIDMKSELNAYYCCIGRVTMKGTAKKEGTNGCNWTAGGLFATAGKGNVVITPEGKEVDVFAFYEE